MKGMSLEGALWHTAWLHVTALLPGLHEFYRWGSWVESGGIIWLGSHSRFEADSDTASLTLSPSSALLGHAAFTGNVWFSLISLTQPSLLSLQCQILNFKFHLTQDALFDLTKSSWPFPLLFHSPHSWTLPSLYWSLILLKKFRKFKVCLYPLTVKTSLRAAGEMEECQFCAPRAWHWSWHRGTARVMMDEKNWNEFAHKRIRPSALPGPLQLWPSWVHDSAFWF